jgi:hypothetical protein
LEIGASSFPRGTTITVTVKNRRSSPIYGLSGQSFCTILDVQRLDGANWVSQARCVAGAPPVPVRIEPNPQVEVDLEPKLANERPLEPGVYRIQFGYRLGSHDGPSATVYSQTFTIDP